MSDRTVHAKRGDIQIVRYDRRGKWMFESVDGRVRQYITLDEAVSHAERIAREGGGEIEWGAPGGLMFESRLRKRLSDLRA